MIEYFVEQNDDTWAKQFKVAVMLTPSINQDNEVDFVTGFECFMHFGAIGWKVLFACVPPKRYGGGWVAFSVALSMIGLVTAIVGECATLFGCTLGLKPSVTAITFVALGTSLPDLFASMTAARESDSADAAVGNVTGSNSVNVFLGLGLPWLIGALYSKGKGNSENGMYRVPAGPLGFSVLIFMITCVACLSFLVIRRAVSVCFNLFYRSLEVNWEENPLENTHHASSAARSGCSTL
jgi:solute carrier family 8 (sodium/calcium exchanger)